MHSKRRMKRLPQERERLDRLSRLETPFSSYAVHEESNSSVVALLGGHRAPRPPLPLTPRPPLPLIPRLPLFSYPIDRTAYPSRGHHLSIPVAVRKEEGGSDVGDGGAAGLECEFPLSAAAENGGAPPLAIHIHDEEEDDVAPHIR